MPTKRSPLRGIVRISFWFLPLSPIAIRAELMRLVSVEFGNASATPDRSDQILPADDVVAVLHQIDQQVEYLRFHGNPLAAAEQLAAFDVKCMIFKGKLHAAFPTASILKK